MRVLKNDNGIVMPLVLLVMVVMVLLGTALWQYSNSELRQANYNEHKTRAYYIARSGAEALARHIKNDPAELSRILGNEEESISEILNMNSELHGKIGEVEVSLKKLEDDNYEIVSVGYSNGVQQTVTIVLESLPFLGDAAVITTGPGNLDFSSGMTVEGSIISGGTVNLNGVVFDDNQYSMTENYTFPDDYFNRVEVPNVEDGQIYIEESTIRLNQQPNNTYKVMAGNYLKVTDQLRSNSDNNKLVINTTETMPTTLVINRLTMNGGEIIVNGSGEVNIYLLSEDKHDHSVQTKNVAMPDGAILNWFLTEGSNLEIYAGAPFQGLIYGPYDASVEMQSGAKFTGAMIVEELRGGGASSIGNSNSEVSFKRGFESEDIKPVTNILYWKP